MLTGLLGLLITGRISPSGGIMGAAVVLLLTGVITPEEAFAGFSNEAVGTIAALYVVAHAVQCSGLLDAAVARVLITDERQRRERRDTAIIRLFLDTGMRLAEMARQRANVPVRPVDR